MGYPFNLEAAIDAIAALERAMPAPAGLAAISATDYGQNPPEIGGPDELPLVVHLPLGPNTAEGGAIPGLVATGQYALSYDIASLLLIIEAIPGGYPEDEAAASPYWLPVCQTFFNRANAISLATAAGALSYACVFPENSYQIRAWPPLSDSPAHFWSIRYTHRFTFYGG